MTSVRKRKKAVFYRRFYSPSVNQYGLGVKVLAQKILDQINSEVVITDHHIGLGRRFSRALYDLDEDPAFQSYGHQHEMENTSHLGEHFDFKSVIESLKAKDPKPGAEIKLFDVGKKLED